MDKNAKVAMVEFGDANYEELGTIPGRKIIKVTKAMKSRRILSIRFTRSLSTEAVANGVYPITLTCFIVIIKSGKWGKDVDCEYNQDI